MSSLSKLKPNLFKCFRKKIFLHALLIILSTLFGEIAGHVINQIMHEQVGQTNYSLPIFIDRLPFLKNVTQSKNKFCIFGVCVSLVYVSLLCLKYFIELKIKTASLYHIRAQILEKHRCLTYENKIIQSNLFHSILVDDSQSFSEGWFIFYNNLISVVCSIVFGSLVWWKSLKTVNKKQIAFMLLSLIFLFFFFCWLEKKMKILEYKYKTMKDKETNTYNKVRNQGNLISCMGLDSQFKVKQQKIFRENIKFRYSSFPLSAISYVFDCFFQYFASFFFVFLGSALFQSVVIHELLDLLVNFEKFFVIFKKRTEFKICKKRINNFFNLEELQNNEQGIYLNNNTPISTIELKNICFKYTTQKIALFENHYQIFTNDKINYLVGSNGKGKSSLSRFILGILKPNSGTVSIKTIDGKEYNLLEEINLLNWREKNVVYLTHDTLFEDGSAGEKQWKNLQQALDKKRDALLWILDEANNSLDEDKQKKIQLILNELLSKKKIIIIIRHPVS